MAAKKRPLKKRILSSRPAHFLLSLIVSTAMRVVYYTSRVQKHFPPEIEVYANGKKPALFCFWHGRLIMQAFVKPPRRSMSVLISQHNDGALITAVMRWFGIGSVRGSNSRGGQKGVRRLLAISERGGNLCITPDGPRGPFQKAAGGAAYVAMKTGYPVIAIAFSTTRHSRLRSWDKFMVPKPFGRMVFVASTPFQVADSDDADALQVATAQLETVLNQVTAEADRLCGVTPA